MMLYAEHKHRGFKNFVMRQVVRYTRQSNTKLFGVYLTTL